MAREVQTRTQEASSRAPESVVERTENKLDGSAYTALGSREIKSGDRGEDVAVLQRRLGLNATGIYNQETEKKVKYVQRIKGLKQTGTVDADVLRYLR